jgi:hypothetical protein
MIDHIRLRQDAEYVVENYSGSPAGRVALDLLRILENPLLACPEGYRMVKMPELLGLGVPQR